MALGIRKIASIGVVACGVLALPCVATAGERDDGGPGARAGHWEHRGAGSTEPSIAAFRERVRAREARGRGQERMSGHEARQPGAGREARERRPIERRRVEPVESRRALPVAAPLRREARVASPAHVDAGRSMVRTGAGHGAPRLASAPRVSSAPRVAGAPRVSSDPRVGEGPRFGYGAPRFGYGPRVIRIVYRGPRFVYRPRFVRFGFRRFGWGPRFGFGFRRFGYGRRFAFR